MAYPFMEPLACVPLDGDQSARNGADTVNAAIAASGLNPAKCQQGMSDGADAATQETERVLKEQHRRAVEAAGVTLVVIFTLLFICLVFILLVQEGVLPPEAKYFVLTPLWAFSVYAYATLVGGAHARSRTRARSCGHAAARALVHARTLGQARNTRST